MGMMAASAMFFFLWISLPWLQSTADYTLFLAFYYSKDLQASYQEQLCMMKLYCFAEAAGSSNSRCFCLTVQHDVTHDGSRE
jgi:hypothetical protein